DAVRQAAGLERGRFHRGGVLGGGVVRGVNLVRRGRGGKGIVRAVRFDASESSRLVSIVEGPRDRH
ncbi:MAG: hypothetical protein KDJ28_16650, partial [Candidatus Competibacteraceae bacterium]|nr:hypothetical protein [Candidatus Competibacteraceae bacterium]